MPDLILQGGTVVTPDGPVRADVAIDGASVTMIEPGIASDGSDVIDCSGCWIGPGFVDLHAHLREPGHEWKEDIESGSRAAAAGGYTAVVAMPNTDPPLDAGHLARFVADRGRQAGLVEVAAAGTLSLGRAGERLSHIDELWAAGVRIFTDDGDWLADAGLLRRAMEYLADLGGVVAQHAEDTGLVRNGHMHEGTVSSRLGMMGRPGVAEAIAIARDLELVRLTGASYHVQHITTGAGADLVRRAKAEGLRVTAEVTPHHLYFDHDAVAGADPLFKVNPPLRPRADVDSLRAALVDGTIDAVATDHAPHAAHEKDVPFEEAPPGLINLETTAATVRTATELDAVGFFDRMSVRPAAIARLERHGRPPVAGGPANLVVFDPDARWIPDLPVSRSSNTPFLGRELTGVVRATIYEGRVTWQDGKVHP